MAWAMVASGWMLSSHTMTPLFWQLVGSAGAGAEDGVDHRAVGVIDDAQRVVQWPRA